MKQQHSIQDSVQKTIMILLKDFTKHTQKHWELLTWKDNKYQSKAT